MGAQDTSRLQHPPTFSLARDDTLAQIIDDLLEEDSAIGYSEATYVSGVFVSTLELWDSPAKLKRRATITYTYSPQPYVSTVNREVYNKDGTAIIAQALTTITRNANNTVNTMNTVITRF